MVGRQQIFRDSEHLGKNRKNYQLKADQHAHGAHQLGAGVKTDPAYPDRTKFQYAAYNQAQDKQRRPGYEEQPSGTIKQHKAQGSPAIAQAPEMGPPTSAVFIQSYWYFRDL